MILQNIWTDASKVLWAATKNRAYFGSITILVPRTWNKLSYSNATTETYDKVSNYKKKTMQFFKL